MSPVLRFQDGTGTDDRGRWLTDIQRWDDRALESVHDYIQWMFPLPEASGFNPGAPLLTADDIAALRASADLQGALTRSLARMRRFYRLPAGGPWLRPGDHNLLRLSRILRCLHLAGLDAETAALLRELEALYDPAVLGPVTLGYWRRAVA